MLPEVIFHITQRGTNRMVCFTRHEDFQRYLAWLGEYATDTGCRLHAYVLMSNHVHLLLSAERADGPSAMMKAINQRYAQYFNRRYERSGGLWQGRYYSCAVQTSYYALACQRYIELNPVRAGMVTHPASHPWSSYRANAQGETNPLITPHRVYLNLGQTRILRLAAYRKLFDTAPDPDSLTEIRQATRGGYALGNDHFAAEISATTGRPASRGQPGRPRKAGDTKSGTDPN